MCDFCKSNIPIVDKNYTSKYADISINMDNGDLLIWGGDVYIAIMEIKYCPVCGAKLYEGTVE